MEQIIAPVFTNAIIFSKDRAMQLELLLRSIEINEIEFDQVTVIYKASGFEYEKAYYELQRTYPDYNWINQSTRSLKECTLEGMDDEYDQVCLLVDDDVFFRKDDVPDITGLKKTCYSYRLGPNIKTKVHFGYPLSVDGHIFLTREIKELSKSIEFDNPNHYESRLQKYKSDYSILASPEHSSLVGIPANKVSDTSGCYDMGVDVAELNHSFLTGSRINYEKIDFSNITNVHENLIYTIEDYNLVKSR